MKKILFLLLFILIAFVLPETTTAQTDEIYHITNQVNDKKKFYSSKDAPKIEDIVLQRDGGLRYEGSQLKIKQEGQGPRTDGYGLFVGLNAIEYRDTTLWCISATITNTEPVIVKLDDEFRFKLNNEKELTTWCDVADEDFAGTKPSVWAQAFATGNLRVYIIHPKWYIDEYMINELYIGIKKLIIKINSFNYIIEKENSLKALARFLMDEQQLIIQEINKN